MEGINHSSKGYGLNYNSTPFIQYTGIPGGQYELKCAVKDISNHLTHGIAGLNNATLLQLQPDIPVKLNFNQFVSCQIYK